jgi:virginiamycin B lyase
MIINFASPWAKSVYKLVCSLSLFGIFCSLASSPSQAQSQPALAGIVTSENEGAMEGVLISAHAPGENVTITVVSDANGHYSFPAGRLKAAKYSLAVRAVGYEIAQNTTVEVGAKKSGDVNIKLVATKDLASQLTSAEWLESVPGTKEQKRALFRCDACHSLGPILRSKHDSTSWLPTLTRMGSWLGPSTMEEPIGPSGKVWPGDPKLAEYLASINLSAGRKTWPFELKHFSRPHGDATKVIITEYKLPRAGSLPHDLNIGRDGMIWFNDFHRAFVSKLDPTTGKVKEWMMPVLKPSLAQSSLAIELDKEGNPWLARFYQGCAATMFDVKTEKFQTWTAPAEYNDDHAACPMINVAANGMVWFTDVGRDAMFELNPKTGQVRYFDGFPPGTRKTVGGFYHFGIDEKFRSDGSHDIYGTAVDSNGDPIYNDFGGGNIATLDSKTGTVTLYPTPTTDSGPRRGTVDGDGRFWFGEYMAGQLGMFDPKTKQIKEWRPPVPWNGLYPAVADKNGDTWSGGMSTDYIYRFNQATGNWTLYLLPTLDGQIRDIRVDDSLRPVTVWVPLVKAGIIAKIEPQD